MPRLRILVNDIQAVGVGRHKDGAYNRIDDKIESLTIASTRFSSLWQVSAGVYFKLYVSCEVSESSKDTGPG